MDNHADRDNQVLRNIELVEPVRLSWGEIKWIVGNEQMAGAEQTLGLVTIKSGKRNPLHIHPNCEELMFVLEGSAEHKLGDDTYSISAGDTIRIPRGVPHFAQAGGDGDLKALISFSSGDRQTVNLDSTDELA